MKKPDDQPRDEYDFRHGTRGSHHRRLAEKGALVRLDPEVNTALQTLPSTAPEDD